MKLRLSLNTRQKRGLVGVVVVLLIGILFFYQKIPDHRIQLKRTIDAFTEGKSFSDVQDCEKYSDYRKYFCIEGVGASSFSSRNFTDEAIEMWLRKNKNQSPFYFIGLGFSLGNTDLQRVSKKLELLFSQDQLAYVVDGWAFFQVLMLKIDVKKVIKSCDTLIEKGLVGACNFGIGRGLFFKTYLYGKENIENLPRHVLLGIGFAESFSARIISPNAIKSEGNALAEKIIDIINNGRRDEVVDLCLVQGRHLIKCFPAQRTK